MKRYAFLTKTFSGYSLEIRTDYNMSLGKELHFSIHATKKSAKEMSNCLGATPWNF